MAGRAQARGEVLQRDAVALVAPKGRRSGVGAVLDERGIDFSLVRRSRKMPVAETASVLVICATGTLSEAISTELEPLRSSSSWAQPVVIVCDELRPGELRLALAAGVAGVVLESELAGSLGPCLEAVRAGQICVPHRHRRQIEPETLSGREKQILGLVVMGDTNSQIAERLFLVESTVKSHLSSAFSKLGVRSRNEAVELILDPERGGGMGILGLGGEPMEMVPGADR